MAKDFTLTKKHEDLIQFIVDHVDAFQSATVLSDEDDTGVERWVNYMLMNAPDSLKVKKNEFWKALRLNDAKNALANKPKVKDWLTDKFYSLRENEHVALYDELKATRSPSGSPNIKMILERRFKTIWNERYITRELDEALKANKDLESKQVSVIFKAPE